MCVVTPSFNQVQFVAQAVNSVLAQTYPQLEYIVQDAQSTDGSADVLRTYTGQRITVRIEPDEGQADALNRGFAQTTGEIMAYLNSDDLLLPGILLRVGAYFRDHPEVDVIYGNRLIVNEHNQEIGRWVLPGHDPELLRYIDYVPQECMFWRRRAWNKAGGQFDRQLQFAMDWDLILRFIHSGAVFRHVPELFGIFRVHSSQKTQSSFRTRGLNEIQQLKVRYGGSAIPPLRRWLHHGLYLYAHRQADARHAS